MPKLYYCHDGLLKKKNQSKRPNQNGRVQNDFSKMALWSNWTWGQKDHIALF